jgi:hypothetical protein
VEKSGRKKYVNREEWKKLLRMARNRHILHMAKELMNINLTGRLSNVYEKF